MNIALLVIDVQKAFIGNRSNSIEYQNTMEVINAVSSIFRKSGKPVIIIRDIEEGNGDEYKNVDELIVHQDDIHIEKLHSNSFWKTDLEDILKEKKVDFVVLCGNAAEYCVLATYNGARERGFGAAMLQHGIFSNYPMGLQDLYNNRDLISYEVISYLFK